MQGPPCAHAAPKRPRQGGGEGGFSLVEALAALAVLGLMSLMILAGLGGRSIAWSRLDRETAHGEQVAAVEDILRERLQHIWPVTLYDRTPPGPDFRGSTDHVEFLAPPPEQDRPAPLRRYQLALDAQGELVLDSVSDVALDQDHWSDRKVLLRGVQSLTFVYFGPQSDPQSTSVLAGGAPGWSPDWRLRATLPQLIRMRVAFAEGDPRRWPDLMVHPMADIDSSCILSSGPGSGSGSEPGSGLASGSWPGCRGR